MTRFTSKLLLIAALALVATSANATVWIISGGGLSTWFTNGTNGGSNQTVYESGFGTNAQAPGPRFSGYNCLGVTGASCADDDGTGPDAAQSEVWGAAAGYSGFYDDNGTQGDASDDTGTISWTGESGTAASAGIELFTTSINSGSYDVATGVVTTPNASVTGGIAPFGMNCWNNPTAVGAYGANFCGNLTGGAAFTTGAAQPIFSRYLPEGSVNFVRNSGDGSITVTLANLTYSSCTAANPLTCGSSSSDIFGVWTLTSSTVPVPAAVWLFGSALGLLGWLRRKTS